MAANFQLYRTNPLLSGQVRWDITLDYLDGELRVNNFQLNPISDHIPHSVNTNKYMLNSSHLENLKSYYNSIKENFYADGTPNILNGTEPIILNTDKFDGDYVKKQLRIDPHYSGNEMGLSRAKYSVYHKPLQFFCPVWIEAYDPLNEELGFRFVVMSGSQKSIIRTCIFKRNDSSYHNNFCEYFNNYINDIKLDDNLLNVDLDNFIALLRGVDVKAGAYIKSRNITSIISTLLQSEKLLMDADNIIISYFKNHHMIARQLFNFNFMFDYEDIITSEMERMIKGRSINISVEVFKRNTTTGKEEVFPLKDFYSNYEYIECLPRGDSDGEKHNIFDVNLDHHNIDIIDKNKISQNIVHWCVDSRDDYIFNLYSSFGGYLMDNSSGKPVEIRSEHYYQNSINVYDDDQSKWCESVSIYNINDLASLVSNTDKYIKSGQYTILGNKWMNHVKFKEPLKNPIKVLLVDVSDYLYNQLSSIVGGPMYRINDMTLRIVGGSDDAPDMIFIICEHERFLDMSFNKFRKIILNQSGEFIGDDNNDNTRIENIISNIQNWLRSINYPKTFELPRLGYARCASPTKETTELKHYVCKNNKTKIVRYGGNLRPCMVNPNLNFLYYKNIVDSNRLSDTEYCKYSNTKYAKKFKSIGYYPYKSIDISDSEAMIDFKNNMLPYEYKLLGESRVIILDTDIQTNITKTCEYSTININDLIGDELKEALQIYYDISDDSLIEYILNQYNTIIDWDYDVVEESGQLKKIFNFKIKFMLK